MSSAKKISIPETLAGQYFVYLLRCKDQTLYCGYSKNLRERLDLHNSGKGAKYTKSRGPVKLVYFEKYKSQRTAMLREIEIKKWPQAKKLTLIK